jgi:hypothetical protein
MMALYQEDAIISYITTGMLSRITHVDGVDENDFPVLKDCFGKTVVREECKIVWLSLTKKEFDRGQLIVGGEWKDGVSQKSIEQKYSESYDDLRPRLNDARRRRNFEVKTVVIPLHSNGSVIDVQLVVVRSLEVQMCLAESVFALMRSRASPIRSRRCECIHHTPTSENAFTNNRMLGRLGAYIPTVQISDLSTITFTVVDDRKFRVSEVSPRRPIGASEVNSTIEMYPINGAVRLIDDNKDEAWPDTGEAEWEEYNRTFKMGPEAHVTDGSADDDDDE